MASFSENEQAVDRERSNSTPHSSVWWRLRTQAYLVLGVLLFLIVFLGAYALSEARRHAVEADELLTANFKASTILKEIENWYTDETRAIAKYRVTGDAAYRLMAQKQHERVADSIDLLRETLGDDLCFISARTLSRSTLSQNLREIENCLEDQRSQRVERIRLVARDLGKIIFVAFLIAIGVTGWLAVVLYQAVLKPLESIKRAAGRIREGELSYRVEKFWGFGELTALREEFNSMASKLEELDRMKGDFLSTVSHELKTPLTALKEGLALLTEKQGELSPKIVSRSLEVCNQAMKRLETMIQNLLNHSKMESGFYFYDERMKNLVQVLENAIQGIKPIADRKKMNIELIVRTDNPQAPFSVEGISHVAENLLLNAIKYGDNDHPIFVEVDLLKTDPVASLQVKVRNHGKGLLPGELKQVFERFFRGSNAEGQQGVGLGLNVVKRIVEAHHGMVHAESGASITTFSFTIPQINMLRARQHRTHFIEV